jgi:hypothetical protein
MIGAVLIGRVPAQEYQYMWVLYKIVVDYYYEELNGTWRDEDNNGILDNIRGDIKPEIWVGRLTPPTNDTAEMKRQLTAYFKRALMYMTGKLLRPGETKPTNKVLLYVDTGEIDTYTRKPDGWYDPVTGWGEEYFTAFQEAYRRIDIDFIRTKDFLTPDPTTAEDYKKRLESVDEYEGKYYEWVQVMVHGDTYRHMFRTQQRGVYKFTAHTYFWAKTLDEINQTAFFYNLFACNAGRFANMSSISIHEHYLAGEYVFGKVNDYGLGAIAPTHSGGMLGFQYFYDRINDGSMVGTALLSWWKSFGMNIAPKDPRISCYLDYNVWDGTFLPGRSGILGHESWFIHLVYIGDPALRT